VKSLTRRASETKSENRRIERAGRKIKYATSEPAAARALLISQAASQPAGTMGAYT
jgi:hypothetical protein